MVRRGASPIMMIGLGLVLAFIGVMPISEARALQGAAPYIQCGGSGGTCKGQLHRCQDAPWPSHKCVSGFTCKRVNQYYWQCESKTAKAPSAARPASDFKQCGGSGNGCTGSKCKDAQWPGVTCSKGLQCYKVSPYYWQCDTHQPAMKPATVYKPSDFKQCGGKGGSCKGSACRDAQTGTCKTGLTCERKSQYFWSCQLKAKSG